jgi:hypothetical protein
MRILESLADWDDDVAVIDDVEGELFNTVAGRLRMQQQRGRSNGTSPLLTGGDLDAQWEMAELSGDEAAFGSMMTPDQNVLDELGAAMGLTYEDDEELWLGVKESDRDRHRWELDPASAEDWAERRRR